MSEREYRNLHHLSHAYIISSPDPAQAEARAREIAAAAVCSGSGPAPCGSCRDCRKAAMGIHPDIISIGRLEDDKGRLKKEIGVEQIRQLSADALVVPNEADKKVYIIREAELMNLSAQNAALKLLEEPPQWVIFILCLSNAQQLLPTVRSRCAELVCKAEDSSRDEAAEKLAREYLKAVSSGDSAKLCAWCFQNEGIDSRAATAFTQAAAGLIADMLCGRRDSLGIDPGRLYALSGLLENCGSLMKVNVGVKHIFGLLAVDSLPVGRNRG